MTDPQPKPPREVKHELHIIPGSESVLRLVAVAPTQLDLALTKSHASGRTCTLTLQGTQKNLPADTVCNVLFDTTSQHADPRVHTVVGVPMRIEGSHCIVQVDVDVFEAGLFGTGQSRLTVVPDFPLAEGCVVQKPFEFDHALHIQGLDLKDGKALFGQFFKLKPIRDSFFEDTKLMLSVFHSPPLEKNKKPKMAPETERFVTFDWAEDDKALHWRIGCAQVQGELMLGGLLSYEDSCVYDLRLEVFQETPDEVQRYLIWEKPRALEFKRPTLQAFELRDPFIHIDVSDIDPDFSLPLEVSLWQWKTPPTEQDRARVPVMERLGEPFSVDAPSSSWSWRMLNSDEEESGQLFALLRIPRSLSGSDEYIPLSRVFNYNAENFKLFDDEQLWLEPSKPSNKVKDKVKDKAKDKEPDKPRPVLATALASQELSFHPSRSPEFGDITVGVRDDKMCISLKLIGAPSYWSEAAPVLSIRGEVEDPARGLRSDPRGPSSYPLEKQPRQELMKLTPTPSAGNSRLYEALLPLADKRLLGRTVEIRGETSRSRAMLWGEVVAAPLPHSIEYDARPHLGTPGTRVIDLTDDTAQLELRCQTRHLPNGGKDVAVLGFRISEQYSESFDPIVLPSIRIRYDLPKDKGGLCDAQGVLRARVVNERQAQRLRDKGKYLLEVMVLNNAGKVLTHPVPAGSAHFGGAPRSIAGQLIYQQGPKKVSEEFKFKVLAICRELEIEPNYLMACMAFETGESFSAQVQNRGGSQAYGLIQFTPIAAKSLSKSLDEIKVMTEIQQLDCVHLYMAKCIQDKGPLRTLSDVYMAILCPAAVGKPETYVCYRSPSEAYRMNQGLDTHPTSPDKKKGYITKQDATAKVTAIYDKAKSEL